MVDSMKSIIWKSGINTCGFGFECCSVNNLFYLNEKSNSYNHVKNKKSKKSINKIIKITKSFFDTINVYGITLTFRS